MKITEKKLLELGFTCDRPRDEYNDKDGIWSKDGVTIYQEFWEGKDFMVVTRLDEDGEFKSGNIIKDIKHLAALYEGTTRKKLKL